MAALHLVATPYAVVSSYTTLLDATSSSPVERAGATYSAHDADA